MNLTSIENQSGANFSLHLNLALYIQLTSLSPGTTYNYYINATNTHGSTRTFERSFKTLDLRMYNICSLDINRDYLFLYDSIKPCYRFIINWN